MPYKDPAKARARRRNRDHIRRAAVSDITTQQELEMRKRARKCPLCGAWMTGKPNLPNSKHLDHILPISQGGTHTHGNVRIICAACNLRRPRNGSDYAGPLTLWAQGPAPVRRSRTTCRSGKHPWVPENIRARPDGVLRCIACENERWHKRTTLHTCECGALFAAPGRTFMCPACITLAAHRAAELHADGMTWKQVAAMVGYTTAEGARYAAKRIGYQPAPGRTVSILTMAGG